MTTWKVIVDVIVPFFLSDISRICIQSFSGDKFAGSNQAKYTQFVGRTQNFLFASANIVKSKLIIIIIKLIIVPVYTFNWREVWMI